MTSNTRRCAFYGSIFLEYNLGYIDSHRPSDESGPRLFLKGEKVIDEAYSYCFNRISSARRVCGAITRADSATRRANGLGAADRRRDTRQQRTACGRDAHRRKSRGGIGADEHAGANRRADSHTRRGTPTRHRVYIRLQSQRRRRRG